VLWAALRFGVLAWLSDKDHPVRPVVEASNWVAGVAGFVVALAALMLARRQARARSMAAAHRRRTSPAQLRSFAPCS